MSGYPRGGDTEKHSGKQRDCESEAEHRQRGRSLDRQIAFPRNQLDDQMRASVRKSYADKTAEHRENNAFGESLTNEIAARGAKGGADRDLGFTRRSAYEHQVGEIGTSNKK